MKEEYFQLRAGEQDSRLAEWAYFSGQQFRYTEEDTLLIETPDGQMNAPCGWWIVRDHLGQVRVCSPEDHAKRLRAAT